MSASSKKKLRKEQNMAQLTEKQSKERAEAKKLKRNTIIFVTALILIVALGIGVLVYSNIQRSGIVEKNTTALTIDGTKINAVEMNYYYTDTINTEYNNWYNSYGDSMVAIMQLMGLDMTQPLDKQLYTDGERTWAEFFIDAAIDRAKSDYALYNAAMADESFTLSEEDKANLETAKSNMLLQATMNNYKDLDAFLVANYGYGASEKSYDEYSLRSATAAAYYNAHADSLTYDDADVEAHNKENFNNYSSFTYATYSVNRSDYLTGGTTGEDGNTTYTDAEREAALKEAEKIANELAKAEDLESLDKAIAALEINAEKESASSVHNEDLLYTAINSALRDWLADSSRKENDITVIPNQYTTTDENGKETTTANGYYVVLFQSRNDNVEPLGNVRHLLVVPEGGTKDENGQTTYTDAELAAAKEKAEGFLKTWKDGEATEDSFIELVKENSADGSASEGGLFEDITPEDGIYVESFRDWAIDPDRKKGDAEVIESEFGYHVMYYVGDDEVTYREYMIKNDLLTADMTEWYEGLREAVTVTEGNLSKLRTNLVLAG